MTIKQQLAAVRMLFDWLITGQVVPVNPASAVRGPKHVVKTGKTPVLDGKERRKLIDAIPTETVRDLRDRALIATLTYSFARIGAALKMRVEDLRSQGAGWQLQLHEKGGKHHTMPCHRATVPPCARRGVARLHRRRRHCRGPQGLAVPHVLADTPLQSYPTSPWYSPMPGV
jgi:site-specific recombinase XerC